MKNEATLTARVVPGKEQDGAKFSDYFEHDEPLKSAPSHRALAIFRGRNEGIPREKELENDAELYRRVSAHSSEVLELTAKNDVQAPVNAG